MSPYFKSCVANGEDLVHEDINLNPSFFEVPESVPSRGTTVFKSC
jgi:hypothetical protein